MKCHHGYVCVGEKQYREGLVLSMVSGIHWGLGMVFSTDKLGEELLYLLKTSSQLVLASKMLPLCCIVLFRQKKKIGG